MLIHSTLRETKQYAKVYLDKLCQSYAVTKAQRAGINAQQCDFGKQDSRGTPSITFFGERGTVEYSQKHFYTNKEMIAYIQGYLDSTWDIELSESRDKGNK